ncbi:MAG: hypothetical protein A2469_03920 [Candidatus Magasanikbacteria bacterium RIFOXYC2_FULL_40_16]|uniref:histidine kinase n=3 Tax=Candidatus Magasanikiibacteriota TaxID=1752731 RepID=A0A1F6NF84_9BACT|nr:MAG: hypothetical protein A2224_03220 [Candidatus Magasanikbacteria bacterium RIFOXYA2_FULL_40_20]OGH82403.1 MAG: hypothetical protein A2373_03185 [Candidatus Magasanikbacteria bacterium RIFOXYB1_FULL_40_15]OGH85138.1 MAG: hypothetical protein A2301_01905 [Candidatus Magasanikbacteria bacterium RIFOXYB2_FULL_40_13]OGH87882.1 MAG: hypothetical protein A2206_00240 [Candidatus Magasanikbacteria bacterium RIFOXYA1_FULL_40_8]OGH89383.1 MAG: hypothetical protein A2469_03920 [Candidatus Magasanikba
MEECGKNQNIKKEIGGCSYLNKNCWLVKNLNYLPYKRCQYCEFKFRHCLFLQYQIISLVLLVVSFSLFIFCEKKLSALVVIVISTLIIVYGYFFNSSTEKIIKSNFSLRKTKDALKELSDSLEDKVIEQTKDIREKNKYEVKQREKLSKLAQSLEVANLRLQELDKQKTEFLSIASHQLRTPISIIKGYIELIKDGVYGKITEKTRKILSDVDTTNERLEKLVDEFLDVSRIEQGRTKFVFEVKNINDLVTSVVEELKGMAKSSGLEIDWKPGDEKIDVCMDEEKIRHVIFNFVDNAIKYTKEGTVSVSVEREGEGVNVKVKDTGFGFDKVDEANFFQKFYRGKNVEHTNVNGTGLGIYVCRQFIEKHKGRVWAKSAGLGQGSEFGFWIPKENICEE